jgi:hypothetical protein
VTAAKRVLGRPAFSLDALGVPESLRQLLLCLHLVEMALRFDEARATGVGVVDRRYRRPLEILLR